MFNRLLKLKEKNQYLADDFKPKRFVFDVESQTQSEAPKTKPGSIPSVREAFDVAKEDLAQGFDMKPTVDKNVEEILKIIKKKDSNKNYDKLKPSLKQQFILAFKEYIKNAPTKKGKKIESKDLTIDKINAILKTLSEDTQRRSKTLSIKQGNDRSYHYEFPNQKNFIPITDSEKKEPAGEKKEELDSAKAYAEVLKKVEQTFAYYEKMSPGDLCTKFKNADQLRDAVMRDLGNYHINLPWKTKEAVHIQNNGLHFKLNPYSLTWPKGKDTWSSPLYKKMKGKLDVERQQPEEAAAISSFLESMKKAGYKSRKSRIKLPSKQVGVGTTYRVPYSRNLPIYGEGGKRIINAESLGDYQATAKTEKSYVINYRGKEYVYINTEIKGSIKTANYKGWIRLSRLEDQDTSKAKVVEERTKVKVDKAKIEAKREAKAKSEAREKARTTHWNRETGEIKFTGKTPADRYKALQKTTINILWPKAKEGQQVSVKAPFGGAKTATLKNGVWRYTNGERAKIYNGTKVVPLFADTYKEKVPTKPEKPLPKGAKLLEHKPRKLSAAQLEKAMAGTLNWNSIAKKIIEAQGQFWNKIKDNGYTVSTYAKLLSAYSTDTGYYWVILPGATPAVIKKRAAESAKRIEEEAKKRDEKAKGEKTARVGKARKAWKQRLWFDEEKFDQFDKSTEMKKLISSPAKWKKAWNEKYPIDTDQIMRAFREMPPYNRLPETAIRDTLREAMYHSVTSNGMDFMDFFNYFNTQSNPPLYTTIAGNKQCKYSDLVADWNAIKRVNEKANENQEEHAKDVEEGESSSYRSPDYDFDEEDKKIWRMSTKKKAEINKLVDGACVIFDTIYNQAWKTKAERVKVVRTVAFQETYTENDKKTADFHKNSILDTDYIDVNDSMNKYISGKDRMNPKWAKMWDNNEGNIGLLKASLRKHPYNKIGMELYKARVLELIRASWAFSIRRVNFKNILIHLNKDGEIYKNTDGEPGDFSDFKEEFELEKIGFKILNGKSVTEDELEKYDEAENKEDLGKERYAELYELYISTGRVLSAISKLDPLNSYSEKVNESELPRSFVNNIFDPSNTGSFGGRTQDYYDTHKLEGHDAGFKLFGYDWRDTDIGITEMDKVSSEHTANRIILDSCRDDKDPNKIDPNKVQIRLNDLVRKGVTAILILPKSEKKDKLLKKLGIKEEDKNNQNVIVSTAKKHAIKIEKGVKLTDMQKSLVQLGFLMESSALEGEVTKTPEKPIPWSTNPTVRELQELAYSNGVLAPEEHEKIEREFKKTMIAFFHLNLGDVQDGKWSGVREFGVTIPVKIAGDKDNSLAILLQPAAVLEDGKLDRFVFRGALAGSAQVTEGVTLHGGLGADTDGNAFAGAGVTFDIPVGKKDVWDPTITIGGMVSVGIAQAVESGDLGKFVTGFVGVGLMFTRNLQKQYAVDLEEALIKAGYENIEKAGNVHAKAQALRNMPGENGIAMTQLQYNMKMNDEQLIRFYNSYLKEKIEEQTRLAGLSEHKFLGFLPPITKFGVGVGLQFGANKTNTGVGVSVVPGIAFAFSIGSSLIVYQNPSASTAYLRERADQKMTAKAHEQLLLREFKASAQQAGYTSVEFKSTSDELVGNSTVGPRPIKTESHSATLESENAKDDAELDKLFKGYQAEMIKQGMKITLDKATDMYKVEMLNIGNCKVFIDPQMNANIGVFLRGGNIFISASKNPKLIIKRFDAYYPRPKEGNAKHTFVTISDNPYRSQNAVIADSDYYLDTITTDHTGTYRKPWARRSVRTPGRKIDQKNLQVWGKGTKNTFDTLTTVTAETKERRKNAEIRARLRKMGSDFRSSIGEADINGVDMEAMHKKAEEFKAGNDFLYKQLTTFQLKTEPQLKKLDDALKKQFPGLSPDEYNAIQEELFNLSMANEKARIDKLPAEKQTAAKRRIINQRLTWMKTTIYTPFFERYRDNDNNPNKYTTDQLAEAFIGPLREMALENAETLDVGTSIDVAVGTLNVFGRRAFRVAHSNIEGHKVYRGKNYLEALKTGIPPIDKAIALMIRESHNPHGSIENARNPELTKEQEFLNSPLAMKLMLLGTTTQGGPVLAYALGEDTYKTLTSLYKTKPPTTVTQGTPKYNAVYTFVKLAERLHDAQIGKGEGVTLMRMNDKEYYSIEINGVRFGIRIEELGSGAYERCLNATHLFSDEIIAVRSEEKYEMVGNMMVFGAGAQQTLVTSSFVDQTEIGFGASITFKPPSTKITTEKNPPEEDPVPAPEGQADVDAKGKGSDTGNDATDGNSKQEFDGE